MLSTSFSSESKTLAHTHTIGRKLITGWGVSVWTHANMTWGWGGTFQRHYKAALLYVHVTPNKKRPATCKFFSLYMLKPLTFTKITIPVLNLGPRQHRRSWATSILFRITLPSIELRKNDTNCSDFFLLWEQNFYWENSPFCPPFPVALAGCTWSVEAGSPSFMCTFFLFNCFVFI